MNKPIIDTDTARRLQLATPGRDTARRPTYADTISTETFLRLIRRDGAWLPGLEVYTLERWQIIPCGSDGTYIYRPDGSPATVAEAYEALYQI